jgi:uncharacterized membrane protein YczE
LYIGLGLYGASTAVMPRAGLGLDPWGVFHQGIAEHTGLSIGTVPLLWPLRQSAGLGNVPNVLLVGADTHIGQARRRP